MTRHTPPVFGIEPEWSSQATLYESVTRRIAAPWATLRAMVTESPAFAPGSTIDLGDGLSVRIDTSFTPSEAWPLPVCHAEGRLSGGRSVRGRAVRVSLDVAAWSDRDSELSVRPMTRHFAQWGIHRQREYFTWAHHAADDLARLVSATG